MPTVEVQRFEDSFIIHFGMEGSRINAYTLASTLTKLADAAKTANSEINPGYDIEILVESLSDGSFKAKIRSIYRGASNLFSKESAKTIVLAIIAMYIYDKTLEPDADVNVSVGTSEVVIVQGDTRIVVPRIVHDSVQRIRSNQVFESNLSQMMQGISKDENISSIAFSAVEEDEKKSSLTIPRNRFSALSDIAIIEDSNVRVLTEITELYISRAILERSTRLWEFVWNGVKISAPVLDEHFYDDFFAHRITIAPGDALRVRLSIKQRLITDNNLYINDSYEVLEVLEHIPQNPQSTLGLNHEDDKINE